MTGSTGIPLIGINGAAELVAGKTEITFKHGSSDNTITIKVRQPSRPEIELEAKVSGDYSTGNFTLKGSEIGQPVDMASSRAFTITGPTERHTNWEYRGSQECLVETTYQPCDESWSVAFRAVDGKELGSFASRSFARCNERRYEQFCRRDPMRDPYYPRGSDHRRIMSSLQESGSSVKFD